MFTLQIKFSKVANDEILKDRINMDKQDEQDERLWIKPQKDVVLYPEYPVHPCEKGLYVLFASG
jgi:hypothetical protein